MPKYISSVVVTLSPKKKYSSDPLVSKVIQLDYVTGCTIPQSSHFICKSPLIKPYLSHYNIIGFIFNYSGL